ncbi:hypothetical protein [Gordonia sp. (in: high G+C Gram-positive bacteria)]
MKLLGILLFLMMVATGQLSGWVVLLLLALWPAYRVLIALVKD